MADRTEVLSIPQQVKLMVADRDAVDGWPCCILCGRTAVAGEKLEYLYEKEAMTIAKKKRAGGGAGDP